MRLLLILLLLFSSVMVHSQRLIKEYYTRDDQKTDSISSYYFSVGRKPLAVTGAMKIALFRDSVTSYFTSTGTIKSKVFYGEKGKRQGPYVEFYPNGAVKEKGVYKDHYKYGEVKTWHTNGAVQATLIFPENNDKESWQDTEFQIMQYFDSLGNQLVKEGNGFCSCFLQTDVIEKGKVIDGLKDSIWNGTKDDTLAYTENYARGKLINGKSFSKGNTFHYTQQNVPPEFQGGYPTMVQFIKSTMKYPRDARKYGISGTVYVTFVVTNDGSIERVELLRGVHSLLDDEALRVVRLMDGKWIPGRQRGKPVFVRFNLPLKFSLN